MFLNQVEDTFKLLRDEALKVLEELFDFLGTNYVLGRFKAKGK
jgi:hypothetical protein